MASSFWIAIFWFLITHALTGKWERECCLLAANLQAQIGLSNGGTVFPPYMGRMDLHCLHY